VRQGGRTADGRLPTRSDRCHQRPRAEYDGACGQPPAEQTELVERLAILVRVARRIVGTGRRAMCWPAFFCACRRSRQDHFGLARGDMKSDTGGTCPVRVSEIPKIPYSWQRHGRVKPGQARPRGVLS
jgi:hypothetical protein